MWLKGFTTYGWLGGFSYFALAIWTMVAGAKLLFRPRPWQPVLQCAYAVFLGHLMIHNVVDNDHWRHLYLIYGLIWGGVAAEKMNARTARRMAAGAVRGAGAVVAPSGAARAAGATPGPTAAFQPSSR